MKNENNYTVTELIEKLKEDNSWELDPKMREKLVDGLLMAIMF